MKLKLKWPKGECCLELADSAWARQLKDMLPCRSSASTWGEEVYFHVPVKAVKEKGARQVVDPGTVCFWVEGQSMAIPFGPTPASQGDECRLVTDVNILGRMLDPARVLSTVKEGDEIELEILSDEAD